MLAAALALATTPTGASDSHAVTVSATVLSKNVCRFTTGGPTQLSFGLVDPAGGTVTVGADVAFRCTGSNPVATYAVTGNDGLHATAAGRPRMQHATDPAQFLPYALNLPATGSAPRNTNQVFTVTGTMTPADFADAVAGAYSDTVVLTIAP